MKHWNRFMFNTKKEEENSERLEIEEEGEMLCKEKEHTE
jgi:hypothetical protein